MTTTHKAAGNFPGEEIVITREFDAPRELVFKSWVEPERLARWWGPGGFTNPVCELDARPGGRIYVVMRGPNCVEYPMGGTFLEIVPSERVVMSCGPLDGAGKYMLVLEHTVTFAEKKGKTILEMRSRVISCTENAKHYLGGYKAGITQSLERLAESLAGKPGPLAMERIFDAPVERVWKAISEKQGLDDWFFQLKEFKAEAGFEFGFTVEHEGFTYVHLCKVLHATPGRKLAFTWRYEGYQGDSTVSIELQPEGEKTRLKLLHEGLETFPKTIAFARKNFERGWNSLIGEGLKKYVESKQDQIFMNTIEGSNPDSEIIITREFNAPRELVWEVWTNPKHVAQWWGPRGFSTSTEIMDFRVGGEWKHVMHGPDGANYPNMSVFREIVKPERIVYTHGGRREDGPGVSFTSIWSFEALEANKTRVTIRMIFPSAERRDFVVKEFGAIEGGRQTLERLGEHLDSMIIGESIFTISREFKAPRELVWKAWTERDHLMKWFGPKGFAISVAKLDLRPGGVFHYCMKSPDGSEIWGKFVYREIWAPEKIVLVNSFSDANGGITRHPMSPTWPLEMLSTTTFVERDGKTTLTLKWFPLNATEVERQTFASAHKGMEGGWNGTFDQLENYLAGSAA